MVRSDGESTLQEQNEGNEMKPMKKEQGERSDFSLWLPTSI